MGRRSLGWALLSVCAACSSGDKNASQNALADAGLGDAGSATRTVCLLTDHKGAIDDGSFVALAFRGVKQVERELGWKSVVGEPKEPTTAGHLEVLDALVAQKCSLIVTAGFLVQEATVSSATAHPDRKYIFLDIALEPPMANVWSQIYATNESAFLAGYVAAGTSKTGTVATLGGMQIPPIVDFMNGFVMGVRRYNSQNGASVEVLGWDPEGQVGTFIGDFINKAKAKELAQKFVEQGADVVFPAAGGLSVEGVAEAVAVKGNAYFIGVDQDWGAEAAYKKTALTSVLKFLDKSIVSTAHAVVDGTFKGGTKTGDLSNSQTGIAPFHDLDALVPAKVKSDLTALQAGIVAKTVKTKP